MASKKRSNTKGSDTLDRHRGGIVPASPRSSSDDGPPVVLPTGTTGERTTAEEDYGSTVEDYGSTVDDSESIAEVEMEDIPQERKPPPPTKKVANPPSGASGQKVANPPRYYQDSASKKKTSPKVVLSRLPSLYDKEVGNETCEEFLTEVRRGKYKAAEWKDFAASCYARKGRWTPPEKHKVGAKDVPRDSGETTPQRTSRRTEVEARRTARRSTEVEKLRMRTPSTSSMDQDPGEEVSPVRPGDLELAALAKRKRGRPPTTGEYVGRAEAIERLAAAKERELRVLEEERSLQAGYVPPETQGTQSLPLEHEVADQVRDLTASEIERRARESLGELERMVSVSGNLKGTFKRGMRLTAVTVKAYCAELLSRTGTGEDSQVGLLRSANDWLKKRLTACESEIAVLREEVAVLRGGQVPRPEATPPDGQSPPSKVPRTLRPHKGGDGGGVGGGPPLGGDPPVEIPQGASISAGSPPPGALTRGVRKGSAESIPGVPARGNARRILGDSPEPSIPISPPYGGGMGMDVEEVGTGGHAGPLSMAQVEALLAEGLRGIEERLMSALERIGGGGGTGGKSGRGGGVVAAAPPAKPLPAQRPLKAKSRKGGGGRAAAPPAGPDRAQQPERGKSRKGGGRMAAAPPAIPDRAQQVPPAAPPPAQAGETWAQVVRRKGGGRGTNRGPAPPQPPPPGPGGPSGRGRGGAAPARTAQIARAKGRRPRPPGPAAVLLSAPEGAGLSVGAAMARARECIDLSGLGIADTRVRSAANGGTLIEVPRPVRVREEDPEPPTSAELADRLAESLRGVLEGTGVRVARPSKFAEMRLRGLDSSVTLGEVRGALMALGGLTGGDLRIGEIRRPSSGPGTVWVRAPVTLVRRVAVAGRVRVGWTWAQVEVLRARPLRCYRCLAIGHVRQHCTGGQDRSGLCYRCGTPGHPAAKCPAGTPKCPVCADLGKPSDHCMGARGCTPPRAARERRGGPSASQGAPGQPQEADPSAATEAADPHPTMGDGTMGGGGTEDMEVEVSLPSDPPLPPAV